MAAIPSVERPPGVPAPWLDIWRGALKSMKEHGMWAPEMRPLLDEYVLALRAASDARDGFAWLDHLEECVASEDVDWMALRAIASGLPSVWDKHAKRAAALADQLGLTPRGRRAAAETKTPTKGASDAQDSFSELDELAPRREGRAGK